MTKSVWRINKEYYDFSNFIKKHPGGSDYIKTTKFCDVTNLLQSHHLNHKKMLKFLPAFKIDCNEGKKRWDEFHGLDKDLSKEDPFPSPSWDPEYLELKEEVNQLFKGKNIKTPWYGWVWYFCWFIIFILISKLYFVDESYIAAILMGVVVHSFLWFLLHESSHVSLSNNNNINKICTFFLSPFVMISAWRAQHDIFHHQFTNSKYDQDIDFVHLSFPNSDKRKENKSYYKYQYLYHNISGALYTIATYASNFIRNYKFVNKLSAVLYFIAFLSFFIISPTILHALIVHLVASFLFAFFSQINHIHEKELCMGKKREGFLLSQISTSVNYKTPLWVRILNLDLFLSKQIEHHLFPGISHWNLYKITPVLKDFCKRKRIYYREYPSAWLTWCAHIRFLKKAGDEENNNIC
ncbi:MAG: fatty acid desaturase [Betaproteobacteria bacterium]|nr:fatty acid desaturase [Betaproteobacteria bacterium]